MKSLSISAILKFLRLLMSVKMIDSLTWLSLRLSTSMSLYFHNNCFQCSSLLKIKMSKCTSLVHLYKHPLQSHLTCCTHVYMYLFDFIVVVIICCIIVNNSHNNNNNNNNNVFLNNYYYDKQQ